MQGGRVQSALSGSHFFLQFSGDVRLPWCVTLENFCQDVIGKHNVSALSVDLNEASNLDSTTLGILAKVLMLAGEAMSTKPVIYCIDDNIYRLLWSMGFEHIATIARTAQPETPQYTEVELVQCDEEDIRASIIDAHEQLMDIDERNVSKFKELVDNLKK